MRTKLERCPFCGSIPKVDTSNRLFIRRKESIEVRQRVVISCVRCFTTKDAVVSSYADHGTPDKELRAMAKRNATDFIEYFWNRREDGLVKPISPRA